MSNSPTPPPTLDQPKNTLTSVSIDMAHYVESQNPLEWRWKASIDQFIDSPQLKKVGIRKTSKNTAKGKLNLLGSCRVQPLHKVGLI